jgi:hypothetical protein
MPAAPKDLDRFGASALGAQAQHVAAVERLGERVEFDHAVVQLSCPRPLLRGLPVHAEALGVAVQPGRQAQTRCDLPGGFIFSAQEGSSDEGENARCGSFEPIGRRRRPSDGHELLHRALDGPCVDPCVARVERGAEIGHHDGSVAGEQLAQPMDVDVERLSSAVVRTRPEQVDQLRDRKRPVARSDHDLEHLERLALRLALETEGHAVELDFEPAEGSNPDPPRPALGVRRQRAPAGAG